MIVPDEILQNQLLNHAIKILPAHYNFEIHKTIWRIQNYKEEINKKDLTVCLQFPEGLMLFACILADIISTFAEVECVIMGDVTYGACCVDDQTTKHLQADFLVHYGHSCLVPITETCVKTLYVFVEISIDMEHFKKTVHLNFPDKTQIIYLMGTVQFNTVMFEAKKQLTEEGYLNIRIPQEKPRSQGEVLGCTSPSLDVQIDSKNVMLFIADGRFHMEAAMIANTDFTSYQYNPYAKELTIEKYDIEMMKEIRYKEIQTAQKKHNRVGVLFGTLGRQGSSHILKRIEQLLTEKNIEYFVLLISEINFDQLSLVADEVDYFVQISCPRLSIDWGSQFQKPLLNPYELFVTLQKAEWRERYPMDYYSNNGEVWTNYYHKKNDQPKKARAKVRLQYEKTQEAQ
ncbi:hypothetical protein PPERSA_01706 [Pseudocohnilembus persalinus]|uniref:2-(3-amino-3-carboxypropyl)histidine synthase subunit 1 n=1 Tax=Pseudocohnilembus persalinus TaxID=266149 RepID=A0A0V0R0Z2_PSEPJ|nr:hypothetical protein PPERSA_01706 [Pseudocohnilembus persalinus]|eukprot:KRX08161.1 hypothetical protein PPERSA_01706 [Pseudocohnilembus persalinus]